MAHQPAPVESRLDRAEEHIRREEWAAALSLFQEVLARVTDPARERELRAEALRRRRELERARREREDGDRPAAAGGGGPAPPVGDDELAPTIEVATQDGILLEPVARAVRRRLLELPAAARELYVRTWEPAATQALQAALEEPIEQAIEDLRRVAERYPLAPSGRRAWEELAVRLADRVGPAAAARALEDRLALPFEEDRARARVLAHAAYRHLLAGAAGAGRGRLEDLARDVPDVPVPIRGSAVLGARVREHPLFERLLEDAEGAQGAPSRWAAPGGGYARGPLRIEEGAIPPPGTEARWVAELVPRFEEDEEDGGVQRGYPLTEIVLLDGRIALRRHGDLVGLDIEGGEVVWESRPSGSYGPAPAGNRINPPERAPGLHSLVLWDPPGAGGAEDALILALDRASPAIMEGNTRRVRHGPNALVALDPRTGKLVWRLEGRMPRPGESKGTAARGEVEAGFALTDLTAGDGDAAGSWSGERLAFLAPPVPAGGLLVAPVTRRGGYYLAGIAAGARDARIVWVQRLWGAADSAVDARLGYHPPPGALATRDGIVWAAPGEGLVAAVAAATGEVLWLSRYRALSRRGSHWLAEPPIAVEHPDGSGRTLLLAAPSDSEYLTAFEGATGEILWERNGHGKGYYHVVGTDGRSVYIAGDRVLALDIATGKPRWESESFQGRGGRGFVAGGRVWVPGPGGWIRVLDGAKGTILHAYRLLDPEVPRKQPYNLFPADGLLLAVNETAVVAVRPQESTWEEVAERSGAGLFRRARVLRGARRYAEALDVLYELEDRWEEEGLHERVVRKIVEVTEEAVRARSDASFITRLLAHEPALVEPPEERLEWRLREAALVLDATPRDAIPLLTELFAEYGRRIRAPDGNRVDPALWASDRLRTLLVEGPPQDDDERKAPQLISEAITGQSHLETLAERGRERLAQASSPAALEEVVLREGHTPASALAGARLAGWAAAENRPGAAAHRLARVLRDHPALAGTEELERRQRAWKAEVPVESPPRFRLPAPAEGAAPGAWKEVFWHDFEEGTAVDGAPGTEPLPALFAVRAGRLRAFDRQGRPVLERELPGYPAVEDARAQLDADAEEPFAASLRGERLVLVTAAGLYGFHLERTDAEDGLDPAGFRLLWRVPFEHPLQRISSSRRRVFGSIGVGSGKNFWPEVDWTPEGDPRVLLPDGEFFRVDRRTGKRLWRFPSPGRGVAGRPRRDADGWVVTCAAPPGLLIYPEPAAGGPRRRPRLLGGPEGARVALRLEGVAFAFSTGSRLHLVDAITRRTLWVRPTSSLPVLLTPDGVWTSNRGNLKTRSLRSGRQIRLLELPDGGVAQRLFRHPEVDGEGTTLVWSASSPSRTVTRRLRAAPAPSSTGTGLWIRRHDAGWDEVWTAQLAKGAVAWDGRRRILPDGRWLFALNVQRGEAGAWYTRLVAVSPSSGEVERWFEAEISGKGTGRSPRCCPVAGGVALGNADGFGWFRREVPADGTEPVDDSPDVEDGEGTGAGPEDRRGSAPAGDGGTSSPNPEAPGGTR